jgi:hypothetical protein
MQGRLPDLTLTGAKITMEGSWRRGGAKSVCSTTAGGWKMTKRIDTASADYRYPLPSETDVYPCQHLLP